MNETDATTFSRREVLLTSLALPIIFSETTTVQADPTVVAKEFVPENDYPFFGYEPDGESITQMTQVSRSSNAKQGE